MRVINPSLTILRDLDRLSLAERIEYCGRICYKSEDRIDKDSAIPFVRKMAEHGHNSVLEMGVTTFRVSNIDQETLDYFFQGQPKFLHIDILAPGILLITGSIRAYRELSLSRPKSAIIQAITQCIAEHHPYFYEHVPLPDKMAQQSGLKLKKVALDEVDQLPQNLFAHHRYLAIRFVVNRAVTHELVRHRPCSFLQESQRYCRYSADKFGNEVTFIKPLFYKKESPEYALWVQAMEETEKLYLQLLESSSPQAARTVLPNSCKTEIIVYTNLAEWQHILSLRTLKNADPSMREIMIPLQKELVNLFPTVFSELT